MNWQLPSLYRHRNDRTDHLRSGISLLLLAWISWAIGLYFLGDSLVLSCIVGHYLGDLRLIYARLGFARLQGLRAPLSSLLGAGRHIKQLLKLQFSRPQWFSSQRTNNMLARLCDGDG